jgi:hypothetical protein
VFLHHLRLANLLTIEAGADQPPSSRSYTQSVLEVEADLSPGVGPRRITPRMKRERWLWRDEAFLECINISMCAKEGKKRDDHFHDDGSTPSRTGVPALFQKAEMATKAGAVPPPSSRSCPTSVLAQVKSIIILP